MDHEDYDSDNYSLPDDYENSEAEGDEECLENCGNSQPEMYLDSSSHDNDLDYVNEEYLENGGESEPETCLDKSKKRKREHPESDMDCDQSKFKKCKNSEMKGADLDCGYEEYLEDSEPEMYLDSSSHDNNNLAYDNEEYLENVGDSEPETYLDSGSHDEPQFHFEKLDNYHVEPLVYNSQQNEVDPLLGTPENNISRRISNN